MNEVERLRDRVVGEIRRIWRLNKTSSVMTFNKITFKIYVTDTPEEAMSRFWHKYFNG